MRSLAARHPWRHAKGTPCKALPAVAKVVGEALQVVSARRVVVGIRLFLSDCSVKQAFGLLIALHNPFLVRSVATKHAETCEPECLRAANHTLEGSCSSTRWL